MQGSNTDSLTVERCKVLFWADGRAALLLQGRGRASNPQSVAFEVNLETLAVLRAEIAKAEQFLAP